MGEHIKKLKQKIGQGDRRKPSPQDRSGTMISKRGNRQGHSKMAFNMHHRWLDFTEALQKAWKSYSVLIVLMGSILLWLVCWLWFYLTHNEQDIFASFDTFMNKHGATIGIIFTILLGVLVALLPTRLEKELVAISERIQSPLSNFDEIFYKALSLLEGLENDTRSSFKMVAASPVFGIELDDSLRKRWEGALVGRIKAGCQTEIICLNPCIVEEQAPLHEFCSALAEFHLHDKDKTEQLFNTAQRDVESFQKLADDPNSKFTLRIGTEPPFQLVIVDDGRGQHAGIFYFASTETLKKEVSVSGIVTQDERMCEIMKKLFEFSSTAATHSEVDPRTELQRERDYELIAHWGKQKEPYEAPMDRIISGLRITVNPRVFPVDASLGGDTLLDAIDRAAKKVWDRVEMDKRLGIDVGTGSGVLSLELSRHCSIVWATDHAKDALDNAQVNFQRRNKLLASSPCEFKVLKGDLLSPLPKIAPHFVPLIVFNQPFYPSPHSVLGTGGPEGGLGVIRPFLRDACALVKGKGGVVMPYCEVAGEHNPLTIATEYKYVSSQLAESDRHKYGKLYVYLFTLS